MMKFVLAENIKGEEFLLTVFTDFKGKEIGEPVPLDLLLETAGLHIEDIIRIGNNVYGYVGIKTKNPNGVISLYLYERNVIDNKLRILSSFKNPSEINMDIIFESCYIANSFKSSR